MESKELYLTFLIISISLTINNFNSYLYKFILKIYYKYYIITYLLFKLGNIIN